MIKVSAPGNIFFFGEHSVVYERPAIVASIDKRTYSKIKERSDDRIIVNSRNYGKIDEKLSEILKKEFNNYSDYKNEMDPIRDLLKQYLTDFEIKNGFEMEIISDIPKNSGGMSSSTAVLCSVLGALDSLFEVSRKKEEYFDYLYPFQVKIHGGSASGSEIISSSLGGYSKVKIDKSKSKLDFENLGTHEYYIVIGDTGIKAKTAEAVQYVKSRWERDKEYYEGIFDEIEKIVQKGEKAILNGDIEHVGELMDENHRLLAEDLMVSHPELDKLVNAAKEAGAYGAKLSGGGRGGIMFALCDEENQKDIGNAIKRTGGIPYLTAVGVEGVRLG